MIYPYQCPECKHDFEVTKSLSLLDRVEPCPACQSTTTHRVPAVTGFTNSDSLGRRKAPADFRNFLQAMDRNTPGSNISRTCDVD